MLDNPNRSINRMKGCKPMSLFSTNLQFDNLNISIIQTQVWQSKCSDNRASTVLCCCCCWCQQCKKPCLAESLSLWMSSSFSLCKMVFLSLDHINNRPGVPTKETPRGKTRSWRLLFSRTHFSPRIQCGTRRRWWLDIRHTLPGWKKKSDVVRHLISPEDRVCVCVYQESLLNRRLLYRLCLFFLWWFSFFKWLEQGREIERRNRFNCWGKIH